MEWNKIDVKLRKSEFYQILEMLYWRLVGL